MTAIVHMSPVRSPDNASELLSAPCASDSDGVAGTQRLTFVPYAEMGRCVSAHLPILPSHLSPHRRARNAYVSAISPDGERGRHSPHACVPSMACVAVRNFSPSGRFLPDDPELS